MASAKGAPVASTDAVPNDEGSIWTQLLSVAAKKESVPPKHLLMLGDVSSGKSTLLAKLQGQSETDSHKSVSLEYTYIELFADDAEDDVIARIHVWQHEGESVEHRELLQLSLNAENFQHSAVIVTVDLLHPWKLASGVQQFLEVVENHINTLKIPHSTMEECQKRQVRRWNEYQEPSSGSTVSRKALPADDPSTYVLPDGVLTKNLGLPIVVVVCKSDSVEQLEKDFGYKDGHFDYIQQHLRRICIRYGASLIYTSTKQSINCGLLMEYLQNQLYELDFGHPAQVVEKESIFVPSGWDSSAKIAADFENQRLTTNPEEPFENVISFPAVLKLHQKDATAIAAATAEDDNNFLTRMYQAVIADTKATPNEKKSAAFFDQLKKYGTAVGATPGATPSATPSSSSSLPPTTPSTDKIAPRALSFTPTSAPQNDEAMSFFNSILQSDTPPVMPTPKKDPKAE